MTQDLELREYQSDFVKLGHKRNIIVCLPTGSGKTQIAVQLAKEYLEDTKKKQKKIIVIATTVALTRQHYETFKRYLPDVRPSASIDEYGIKENGDYSKEQEEKDQVHTVDYLSSDRDIDSWEKSKWTRFFSHCHVIVMTPESLVRALNGNFMEISQISLLVMDECHHTDKKHPMNQIMDNYHEKAAKNGRANLPRIIGLTATIINGKKTGDVGKQVEQVEERLDAKASTHWKYEEVLKYSTKAKVQYEKFSLSGEYSWSSMDSAIKSSLNGFLLELANENPKHFETDRSCEVNHPSFSPDRAFSNKRKEVQKYESIVKDVVQVYDELGPYCGSIAARYKRAFIKSLVRFTNRKAEEFYIKLDNALEEFEANLKQVMSNMKTEAEKVEYFRTEKLGLLLKILDDYRSVPESLCGIVFVQKRLTTQVLCWYLQAFSRSCRGSHIRANFVMGASNTELDAREKQISIAEQTKILQGFRSKQYNLLVATNVIEEGLDVPSCSLIIRLDSIQNYPSFIQSSGRARDPNSKFIAFINKNSTTNEEATYEKFLVFNKQLSAHLKEAALHPFADDDDDDDYRNGSGSEIPDFAPFLSEGRRYPAIPASKSISVVHEYCQTLVSDRFASFQPISWHERVGNGFKAWVQLPSNSVIRDVQTDGVEGGIVEGDVQSTKRLAKCSAFLKVCEQLFDQKCLDPETLLPFPAKHNAALIKMISSLKDGMEKDPEGRKVGSKKRTQQYIKKIADCLNEAEIQPGRKCRVYQIVIEQEPKKSDILSSSIYRFTKRLSSFGLIVPASVDLKIPKFFLHVNPTIGFLTVELKPVQSIEGEEMETGLISFAGGFLRSIQDFERFIYSDILGLKSIFMQESSCSSSILVPLKKNSNTQKLRINSELIHSVIELKDTANGFWQSVPKRGAQHMFGLKRHPDEEMDYLVIPWYKYETEFCAVVEVADDLTPLSPFPVRSGPSRVNYKTYFLDKYPKIKSIDDDEQNLIRVKKIGKNLNFFTNSKNVGKNRMESENIVELIPELTRIHPLPASLYIQAKFLPSILHRINRLLLAKEIEEKVNSPSVGYPVQGWKSHVQRIRSLTLSYEDERKYLKLGQSNINSSQDSTSPLKSPVGKRMKMYNEAKGMSTKDDDVNNNNIDMRLDFINPLDYSSNYELSKMATEIRQRKQARKPFTDSNGLQKSHYLIDVNSSLLTKLKKYDTDFNSVTYPSISSHQPTLFSLMQAMTVSNARDFFSLERLETIGDSFLKFAVTKFLFSNYTKLSEGRMTELKSFLVSNAHLYRLGKKNFELGEYLSSGIFVPETAFLPPGFTVPKKLVEAASRHDINEDVFLIDGENIEKFENWSEEELDRWIVEKQPLMRKFLDDNKKKMKPENTGLKYTRVGDKSVADSVEALLGAYYMAGKATGAYQFMEKLELQGPLLKRNSRVVEGGRIVEEEEVEWIPLQNCPLMTSFGLINKEDSSVGKHLPQYEELQKLINYKFKEPWLLVQAFSHPCYMANNTTPPYERLEFIGDAILDFLITDHIYQTGELTPGQLTDLRSALVNNVTFGSLAVRFGLHKFLLCSQDITQAIRTFVDFQEENNHEITEPFSCIEEDEALVVEDIDVPKILGDIWESLAGAIYVDSGYSLDAVWRVFYRLMKTEIDLFSKNVPMSPVKRFYEKFPQARNLFTNVSDEWREKENMNRELTYIQLNIPHENYREIVGMGKNKKSSKLAACKYAMKFLWNI